MDKAAQYLGLARKGGMLAVGEEGSGAATAAGKARLLMLAADASPNAQKRAAGFLYGHRAPLQTLPWTKAELSAMMGRRGCSMLCFTDLPLAARFAAALAEELPGWKCDITGCRSFEELPQEAQDYVAFVEDLAHTRVTFVGVGAGREQIINRFWK